MQEQQKTKQAMAKQLHTSRSQLDRLLDPSNVSVTLDTITQAASALGNRLIIRVADVKAKHERRPRWCASLRLGDNRKLTSNVNVRGSTRLTG
jgi:hypothetical protein